MTAALRARLQLLSGAVAVVSFIAAALASGVALAGAADAFAAIAVLATAFGAVVQLTDRSGHGERADGCGPAEGASS